MVFFERLVDPFPKKSAQRPPDSVYQFCRHYSRGMEPWLLLMAFLTAITAISEALLFGILGQVVDWLSESNPETFIEQSESTLIGMGIFMLILIPLSNAMRSLVVHQTLMGNFPMSVRWMAHRYLLNQSYGFFQNEFSGRIATKVMQTALAVRDTVMKLPRCNVICGNLHGHSADIGCKMLTPRLCIPLIIWLFFYIIVQRYFVPKMKKIAMVQADARSLMTGRIVDSYTNIVTLKLFSHSNRESAYIRDGMSEFLNTVHPQMRLVTKLNICLWALNMSLVFSTAALGYLSLA